MCNHDIHDTYYGIAVRIYPGTTVTDVATAFNIDGKDDHDTIANINEKFHDLGVVSEIITTDTKTMVVFGAHPHHQGNQADVTETLKDISWSLKEYGIKHQGPYELFLKG